MGLLSASVIFTFRVQSVLLSFASDGLVIPNNKSICAKWALPHYSRDRSFTPNNKCICTEVAFLFPFGCLK